MYEPKIVGFLCSWCSYTGADTAGIARLKYPANLRAVRVPCSGRVSPELILRAFDQGADGVLVLGCHIGECHYGEGNHRTAKRMPALRALLSFAGLEEQRLRLDWVSASEGERFARIVNEFSEAVRTLGPIRWRVASGQYPGSNNLWSAARNQPPTPKPQSLNTDYYSLITANIQAKAKELLESGQVECVIGYEVSPRGRTRPTFVYHPLEVERLIFNQDCTHNLTTYLRQKLHRQSPTPSPQRPVAILVKPCDSRAVNVLLAENQIAREQVHLIGIVCPGIVEPVASNQLPVTNDQSSFQPRCLSCTGRVPGVYDTLFGDESALGSLPELVPSPFDETIAHWQALSPPERMDFWLSQFDRCLRCYACRQACPMCNCPTCLYERDDSLWVGMGIGLDEKRAFHLGRAYHLAGRCIGCEECERACPVGIPISLLNRVLAKELERTYNHRAGYAVKPSPFVTVLSGEEAL